MITPIKSPTSKLLPPAANELYVADSWQNTLGGVPVFSTELRFREGEVITPLGGAACAMTKEQWSAWGSDVDDEEYILNCICSNRGLVRK